MEDNRYYELAMAVMAETLYQKYLDQLHTQMIPQERNTINRYKLWNCLDKIVQFHALNMLVREMVKCL